MLVTSYIMGSTITYQPYLRGEFHQPERHIVLVDDGADGTVECSGILMLNILTCPAAIRAIVCALTDLRFVHTRLPIIVSSGLSVGQSDALSRDPWECTFCDPGR